MENNPLAMETLILCYIEAKNLLRTKQLDQSGFNKLLIKYCREFKKYSDEEILSTWRNLVRQYLQVKNHFVEKESWKYYKIMDSCYEISDFHQGGQSKFSEDMVWFLIECLLKRRTNKRSHKMERMTEVYHEFLEEGYVNLVRSDIETKWRYLNYRYTKLIGNKEAHLKMPYFTAIDDFRKGKKCVKMNFTKSLTEELIKKFTERKIVCNFHGYDSPQLLKEIQYEFQNIDSNFGFDFSCEEIRDKWEKLTIVYEFLKKKHRTKSQWMHFQAMKEHYEYSIIETEIIPWNIIENSSKKRSKSVDEQNANKKSKLMDQQFDERSLSPIDVKKEVISELTSDNVTAIKKQKTENKKYREVESELECNTESDDISKNKEVVDKKKNRNKSVEVSSVSPVEQHKIDDYSKMKQNYESYQKKENDVTKIPNMSLEKQQGCGKVTINITSDPTYREDHTLPNNNTDHVENKNCSELLIPQIKEVNIISVSSIDKDSNVTINLPSITKKFSSNEYLPLKKRLRLNEDKLAPIKDIEDGFRGFTVMDQMEAQFCSKLKDCNQLREEKSKIINNTININNTWLMNYNHEESEDFSSSNYLRNVSQQSDLLPEGEDDPSAVTTSNTDCISPKPVSLQIDESNSPMKEVTFEFGESNSPMKEPIYELDDGPDPKDNEDTYFDRDQHLLGNPKDQDILLKESISSEMIETSIIDEPITEVEIRSFEQYQTPDETIQPSSESAESTLPWRDSGIDEEHLLSTEKPSSTKKSMEFYNQTLNSINEYAEINIISTDPNVGNMEYQTDHFVSTGNHLKSEVNYKEFEDNDEKVITDIQTENKADDLLNVHKSNLCPYDSCNSSQCETEKICSAENDKKEIKSIRLPVTCGGKLKEIFISPRELSKIAQIKPNAIKSLKNSPIITNGEAVVSKNNCKNINFTSHIIKEAGVTMIKNHDEKNYISVDTVNKGNIIPTPPKVSSTTGLVNRNEESLVCPVTEFDGNSVISESMMDDEHLSDDLLDDVIDDFQVQNNQELKDIKNLIRENNFLQRETNTILRQILNKL